MTVALLRGINVGGRRKVPMAALRAALDDTGLGPVTTYIQSGNLALPAPADAATARAIERVLSSTFGLDDVPVVLRTHEELVAAVEANPFAGEGDAEPASVHAVFLHAHPDPDAGLDPERSPGDRFRLADRELWIHYANGAGRSKLDLAYIERTLGVGGTARNLRTIHKLIELSRS